MGTFILVFVLIYASYAQPGIPGECCDSIAWKEQLMIESCELVYDTTNLSNIGEVPGCTSMPCDCANNTELYRYMVGLNVPNKSDPGHDTKWMEPNPDHYTLTYDSYINYTILMPGYYNDIFWNFHGFYFQTANSHGPAVYMSETLSYVWFWNVNTDDWYRCGWGQRYEWYDWITDDDCYLDIRSEEHGFPGRAGIDNIRTNKPPQFNKIQIYMAFGPDRDGWTPPYYIPNNVPWLPNDVNISGPTIFTDGSETYSPSSDPTPSPTNPTIEPTNEPTKDPTTEPTSDPTVDPTTEPTDDPSKDPTQIPSNHPTSNPSVDPTSVPTNDPTTEPTLFVDDIESAFASWIPADIDDLGLQHIMYLVLLSFVLLIFVSLIYSKCIQVNDFYKIGALLAVTIHFNDSLSDAFFCLSISFQDDSDTKELSTIFALSIIFILIPSALTLYQLYHSINQWRRNDELSQWLTHNIKLLYIISILTGSSFAGVRLCSSNLFNMGHFDMPISKTKLIEFQTQSIYSIVLLEVTSFLIFVYCAIRRTR